MNSVASIVCNKSDHQPTPAGHACPSCGAQAHGAYCAHCGEAIHPHAPSAGEFIHEFVGHYVALEGKLWKTLRLLVGKPGELTREHLLGRRVPYINPLRLYLTLSLVVFALIKLVGVSLPQLTLESDAIGISYAHKLADATGETVQTTSFDPLRNEGRKPVRVTVDFQFTATGNDLSYVHAAIGWLESVNPRWTDNGRRFMDAPPEEKAALLNRGFLANLPYMLIGALPLFALYLKLVYWRSGHNYGQHLVFAFHFTAFVFLVAVLMIAIPGNIAWLLICLYEGLPAFLSVWDGLQLLPLLWIAAYLPMALRRVYGGRAWAVQGLSLLLMTVHLLVIVGLVVVAETIAILTHV